MKTMIGQKPIVVVALGGNAITPQSKDADIHRQFANTRQSLKGVVRLVQRGDRVILTHGNGPQVGNALIRVETARHLVPPRPLGVVVADLQGGMGYMIAQSLMNALKYQGIEKKVVTLVTQVLVNERDDSFSHPTKFVGLPCPVEQVAKLKQDRAWVMKEDVGKGWRRVVPSPTPLGILEKESILDLLEQDTVVICAGGGGIPVYYESDGTLEGADAVIDKDLASAVVGRDVGAQKLYILTNVDHVCLNYGSHDERPIACLTLAEAIAYSQDGHFPPGTMGPKVRAAIEFLEGGGEEVFITSVERFTEALEGHTGTKIVSSN